MNVYTKTARTDDFLAHCNKRFTMTCDGEAHWYLSVKYTRDPSGAVSTSQELYIDKILKRWGMESCKPLPTPFPAKSDVVLDELLKPIEHPDPVLNKQFQEIICTSSDNSCTVSNKPYKRSAGP
jgi:hypothetical protein